MVVEHVDVVLRFVAIGEVLEKLMWRSACCHGGWPMLRLLGGTCRSILEGEQISSRKSCMRASMPRFLESGNLEPRGNAVVDLRSMTLSNREFL